MKEKSKESTTMRALIFIFLFFLFLLTSCQSTTEKPEKTSQHAKTLKLLGKFPIKGRITCLSKKKKDKGKQTYPLYLLYPSTGKAMEVKGLFDDQPRSVYPIFYSDFAAIIKAGDCRYYLLRERETQADLMFCGSAYSLERYSYPGGRYLYLWCPSKEDNFLTKEREILKIDLLGDSIQPIKITYPLPAIQIYFSFSPSDKYYALWGELETSESILKLVQVQPRKEYILGKGYVFSSVFWSFDSRYLLFQKDELSFLYDTKTEKLKELLVGYGAPLEGWLSNDTFVYKSEDKNSSFPVEEALSNWKFAKVTESGVKTVAVISSLGEKKSLDHAFSPYGDLEVIELTKDGSLYWIKKGKKPVKIAEGIQVSDNGTCIAWIK